MNGQLQVFKNEEFGKIRVLEIDGQPWFVGKDVTDILGYGNGSRDINRHVDEEDRRNYRNGTSEINNRGITIINESGLYALILSSKLPSAKRFKRWVTSEVLPTIRKHGAYLTDAVLEDALKSQEFAFELLCKLQAEKGKTAALLDKVETLVPKAHYEGAIPHIGEAFFMPRIDKQYKDFNEAFTAAVQLGGKQFLVDMFGGTVPVLPNIKKGKPSVAERIKAASKVPAAPQGKRIHSKSKGGTER